MNTLDRTIQLQQQGMQENEIIATLQQEGFPMKEINDSLNQARIKSALSQEPEQNNYEQSTPQEYPPAQQESPLPQKDIQAEYTAQEYPSYDSNQYVEYPQQGYDPAYQSQGTTSTETITDIAEQVFNEKTQELTKNLKELIQNNKTMQREFQELKERVKRIEDSLDSIQKAIIGKVGEFGESTKMVQKDLENIHGTMSKMMNPLIDNYNELKKLNSNK